MTVDELLKLFVSLWPKLASDWFKAWKPLYHQVLDRHAGKALAEAWEATMARWTYARPPAPADIARHLPEPVSVHKAIAGKSSDGEQPLPFGRQHFDVCRHMADQLYARWFEAHRQWLDVEDRTALHAMMEARTRARQQAAVLAARRHRDAPGEARIAWTEQDWADARARAESQRRAMPAAGEKATRIKPLHVTIVEGRAVMVRDQPKLGVPPAWTTEALPPADDVAELDGAAA